MNTVSNAVVGIGIKGQDAVISTFKKIQSQKDKFAKPVTGNISGTGSSVEQINQKKKEVAENQKILSATKEVGDSLTKLGSGMASLNPTSLIRAGAGVATHLASELAGGIAGALNSGLGKIASAVVSYAGELVDIGAQAASNALTAVKASLPIAAQRQAESSIMTFSGMSALKNSSISKTEAANLANALTPVIGKLNLGDKMSAQLQRLFEVNGQGQGANRGVATALAQGNFSVLGSDKGYFLNQISQSLSGLPPSIVAALRPQLLQQISKQEMGTENFNYRTANVSMQEADLAAQDRIAASALSSEKQWQGILSSNEKLNNLSVTMVDVMSTLTGTLGKVADEFDDILRHFSTTREAAEAEAAEAKSSVEKRRQQGEGMRRALTGRP